MSGPQKQASAQRSPPSEGRSELHEAVQRNLRAWQGFGCFSRLLVEFPQAEVHLAGGALRDSIMGDAKKPKDFDFFITGGDLEEILRLLGREGEIRFGPFGSPRWFPSAGASSYCDIISVSRFNNGLWPCRDIVDVLNQFDFTANAVAIDLRSGAFCDPVNGTKDISNRVMRAVRFDYPDEPISSNHTISRLSVLWFRILHYAALCKLKIEPVTMSWLVKNQAYRQDLNQFAGIFFQPYAGAEMIYDRVQGV